MKSNLRFQFLVLFLQLALLRGILLALSRDFVALSGDFVALLRHFGDLLLDRCDRLLQRCDLCPFDIVLLTARVIRALLHGPVSFLGRWTLL